MPLKVITQEGNALFIHSPQDFERVFQLRYVPGIQFVDGKTQSIIEKRTEKALVKEWITPRQKWLGHYYAEGIRGKIPMDLTIAWIDETIGYGLWTNRDIPAQAFIGEYAGLLRKRRLWRRWQNLYCFDYNIGERRSSNYVIDAQDYGNHTRFINHSFTPNLEPISVYCDGRIHVIVHAKEMIPAGTQLCYDYGDEYWEKRSKPKELGAVPKSEPGA
ncbi:MAG: SET domain-containing protein-lysine N-methyltransferase [Verrucomicrobia bacterium]|nr:SET domain-containing protein-lysine N-methyltransferase [Verrucomicrobiota bacterium]